ncbi:acetylornithine deacetylase [Lasallia pustulata]|uniref:Acetylornithine deacetylase n=1 Tax=Lasallia pustulata TaxID=136370 RepID=A0A1W5D1F5_9LECA|nr:acetylornithine deacetylase [Lasallia pustulata]
MKLFQWPLPHAVAAALFATATASFDSQEPLFHTHAFDPAWTPLSSLHRDLVQIESVSGNEHHVGHYLCQCLRKHNWTVEKQHVGALHTAGEESGGVHSKHPRFNLLAYPGERRDTRILVSSHIDTVPPYWPYEVRPDRDIWGRGSVDAKGSVATQIVAVQELLASGELRDGDLALLFVVGEEIGGDGMRKANELGLKWETAIFGEPTELKLASGHKGNLAFTVTAKGKAGHSGYPWLGESANSMLIPALAVLDKLELPSSEKYGDSTLNIGRMEGGVAGNVIAETARAQIQVRIAAGSAEKSKKIVLDAIQKVDERLEVSFVSEGYGPVYIDSDVEGFDTVVVNYGTDIPNLKGDHKRYLYGPGSILVAHSDHEHLNATDLSQAVEGYKKLIRHALAS